jgi:uncharacterized protein (TIGR03437 family)
LTGGVTEDFRWTLPVAGSGSAYLRAPFFGPDGLTYLGGQTFSELQTTTPNALLESPCSSTTYGSSAIAVVLTPQGDVRLLSYLPGAWVESFSANADGSTSAVLIGGARVAIDLSERPKAACVVDALDRTLSTPPPAFGVGEVMRLRGGGFGPDLPMTLAPGVDRRYPKSVGGLTVEVAGVEAPILSAAPGEVVFVVPFGTPDGDAIPVTVHDRGAQSAALPIRIQTAAPWLAGPVFNSDGTPNTIQTPCHWGSALTVFLTGAGPFSPPLDDGQLAPNDASRRLQLPASFSFFTTTTTPIPGTVLYAGAAPGTIGLAQINLQLPLTGPEPSSGTLVTLITPQLLIGSVPMYVPLISVR